MLSMPIYKFIYQWGCQCGAVGGENSGLGGC